MAIAAVGAISYGRGGTRGCAARRAERGAPDRRGGRVDAGGLTQVHHNGSNGSGSSGSSASGSNGCGDREALLLGVDGVQRAEGLGGEERRAG